MGLALASALGAVSFIQAIWSSTAQDLSGSSLGTSKTLSITLVEAGDLKNIQTWTPARAEYSNRVSSITNASRRLLQGSH